MSAIREAYLNPYSGPPYELVKGDHIPEVTTNVDMKFLDSGYVLPHDDVELFEVKQQEFLKSFLNRTTYFELPQAGRYAGKTVTWIPGYVVGGTDYGPRQSDIAIVTKMPSDDEKQATQYLCGDVGDFLHVAFKSADLNLEGCYATAVTKFTMPYKNMNNVPAAWAKECKYFLYQELSIVQPKFMLICGADALKAILGKKATIKAHRGTLIDIPWLPNTKAVVVNNPADVLRNPEKTNEFNTGFGLFARMVKGDSMADVVEKNYYNIWDLDTLKQHVDILMSYKEFAVDIETTGLEYVNGELLTIQISAAPGHAIVVCLKSLVSGKSFQPCVSKAIHELRRLLCRDDVAVSGHNFRFDIKWLIDVGLDLTRQFVDNGFDTMLASHLLSEVDEHNLTECTLRETTMGRYDAGMEGWLSKGYMHWTVPDEVLYEYAAGDADASFRLYLSYRQKLWDQHVKWCSDHGYDDPYACTYGPNSHKAELYGWCPTVWNLLRHIVLPVNRAMIEMEMEGMLVDKGRLVGMIRSFENKREDILNELRQAIGDPLFNPRSPKDCKDLLFGAPDSVDENGMAKYCLGLRPIKTTGKRGKLWEEVENRGEVRYEDGVGWVSNQHAPSTDSESLAILADEEGCYEAHLLRNFRLVDQVCKNFLRGEEVDEKTGDMDYYKGLVGLMGPDGKLRTSLSQLTETGRWRSAKPNMQNLPKGREGSFAAIFGKDEKVPSIRSGIIAPDGHVFVEADFESAESHTLAWLAKDNVMKEDLAQTDEKGKLMSVHSVTACKIFKLDMSVSEFEVARKTDKRLAGLRVAAKSVNFGIPYQRGGAAIARQVMREGVDCTEEDGKQWVEDWYGRYQNCAKFIDFCKDSVFKPGYIRTPYGRMRHFIPAKYDEVNAAMQREACNFPIQSVVADSLSLGIAYLANRRDMLKLESRIILAIHDAALMLVPYHEVQEVCKVLQTCLSDELEVPGVGLHYNIDIEISKRWCEHPSDELLAKCGF